MIELILQKGGNDYRVFSPSGRNGLKITYQRESGQVFRRAKISGSFSVSGPDYTFLRDAINTCCGQLQFNVRHDGKDITRTFITPYAVEFDEQNCKATVNNFIPNDIYTVIMNNWEKEINILNYGVVKSFPTPYAGQAQQTRARLLIEILHYLLRETLKGTIAESCLRIGGNGYSIFYESDTNPVTKLPNNTLALVHLSDAAKPSALQPAVNGPMTLRSFLSNLRMHKVYWDIDEAGFFRVEHKQFYDLGQSYDIPALNSLTDLRYLGKPATYKYTDENAYSVQEIELTANGSIHQDTQHMPFGGDDAAWPDWVKAGVRFGDCIPGGKEGEVKKDTQTFDWYTDYRMIAYKASGEQTRSEVERQGWVLVELAENAGVYTLTKEAGMMTGADLWNGGQSAANLFVKYHDWGLSFYAGTFNEITYGEGGKYRAARFTEPNQIWGEISLNSCNFQNFNFLRVPVLTQMDENGLSFVETLDWDLATDKVTLVFKTGGICKVNPSEWLGGINPTTPGCAAPGQFIRRTFEYIAVCTIIREYFTDGKCGEKVYVTFANCSDEIIKNGGR